MLSVVVVTFGVAIYNRLYDRFEPHELFYIIGGFYTFLFSLIGLLLMHPTLGIYNTNPDPSRVSLSADGHTYTSRGCGMRVHMHWIMAIISSLLMESDLLNQVLGWVSYCAIESFGSIGVANFWAFANSVYDLESAKKSYGLLVACAQLGSIAGPTLVTQADTLGETYNVNPALSSALDCTRQYTTAMLLRDA